MVLEQPDIMTDNVVDNRRTSRADVSLVARIRRVRSTIDQAHRTPAAGIAVTDISLLGLSFATNLRFDVDDLVEIDLSWRGTEIEFHGVVRHVHERG